MITSYIDVDINGMYKTCFILLYLLFSLAFSYSQIKFPYPINTEDAEYSPALLPDSSIMLMSARGGSVKCYRFVFDEKKWVSTPNSLTSQINSLMFTDDAHGHYRFSDDFSQLVITRIQLENIRYFENKLINGQWGFI